MTFAAALARNRRCPRCGESFDREALFCPRDGTKLEDGEGSGEVDPYIGKEIGGDIEIRAIAGSGAMGRVYRAHQRGIDRDVAVKILHRELSGNTQLVQRFHREAKIASRLQHPHVVEVYLTGQLPDGALYIVMEYLDGLSLQSAMGANGGALPLPRALSIAVQIADAVGEGHVRGIVHRDLKPENVMLVRRAEQNDWVKVLDFGIARVSVGDQSMETAAGLIFGTARYISPEGAQGAPVGPPGDVYSIAIMLYQMLAGRTPFEADRPVGLLVKHLHETPPELRSHPRSAEVPEPIARVVMANLAKDPSQRATHARAFAAALAAAAREAGVSISDAGVHARFSVPDLGAVRGAALDPTLDDISGIEPALSSANRAPSFPSVVMPVPAPRSTPHAEPFVDERLRAAHGELHVGGADHTEETSNAPGASKPLASEVAAATASAAGATSTVNAASGRRSSLTIVLLAFLLGAALAVIVSQQLARHGDDARLAHIARARKALVESRYVSPPKDNVREIVADGIKHWPDDPDFAQIRSDAAHEMVTRSMAARSAGDVGGARDLVHDASLLDSTDHSARMLLGQYEDELRALKSGTMTTGSPKVFFDVPPVARPKQTLAITARILPGTAGPTAKISDLSITLFDNGRTSDGHPFTITSADPSNVRASLVAPEVGSYDVVFEAAVDGRVIRAERDLNVVK